MRNKPPHISRPANRNDTDLDLIIALGKIRQQLGGPDMQPIGEHMAEMVRLGHLSLAETKKTLLRGIFVDLILGAAADTHRQHAKKLFHQWKQSLDEMETLYQSSGHPGADLKVDAVIQAKDHLKDYESWFRKQGRGGENG